MQNLMGRIRRCAEDYNMICAGDKIAVGVSGGKDSLSLLYLLAALRRYYPVPYELQAVTIDMGLPGMDFSPVAALCEKLGAFYKPEQIGIDPALSEDMLSVSAAIRNRLTLIRMRRVLDFGE